MCNIAGYVGTQPAAPLLIDMMRRQEGFCGGYYSGIATLHEGKIYYAKLTGDLTRLVDTTEAARLPGTVGIIHSRSRSGGGDAWAHPFIGERDGRAAIAYVANGEAGFFGGRTPEYNRLANRLLTEGYTMHSRVPAYGGEGGRPGSVRGAARPAGAGGTQGGEPGCAGRDRRADSPTIFYEYGVIYG